MKFSKSDNEKSRTRRKTKGTEILINITKTLFLFLALFLLNSGYAEPLSTSGQRRQVAEYSAKSINILSGGMNVLASKAIKTFKVNQKSIQASLDKNPILVTALNPIIGYAKAAAIAKKAYKENRAIIEVALEETNLSKAKLQKLLNPAKLTKGGIN